MKTVWVVKHISFYQDNVEYNVEIYNTKDEALTAASECYKNVKRDWKNLYKNLEKDPVCDIDEEAGFYSIYRRNFYSSDRDEIEIEEKHIHE